MRKQNSDQGRCFSVVIQEKPKHSSSSASCNRTTTQHRAMFRTITLKSSPILHRLRPRQRMRQRPNQCHWQPGLRLQRCATTVVKWQRPRPSVTPCPVCSLDTSLLSQTPTVTMMLTSTRAKQCPHPSHRRQRYPCTLFHRYNVHPLAH